MATLITYDTANFTWDNNVHLWNLCQRVLGGKSKARRDEDRKQWEKDKKKVIKLVMWRKGIKIYDEKKEVKNIENHIDDIKIIAEELKSKIKVII
tara:strand:- start:424 stop:708 length:285 start_codon:yes stop_codon:yes gene_type:complete